MKELRGKVQHSSFDEPPDHRKFPGPVDDATVVDAVISL